MTFILCWPCTPLCRYIFYFTSLLIIFVVIVAKIPNGNNGSQLYVAHIYCRYRTHCTIIPFYVLFIVNIQIHDQSVLGKELYETCVSMYTFTTSIQGQKFPLKFCNHSCLFYFSWWLGEYSSWSTGRESHLGKRTETAFTIY